jgi:hypothetical protein
MISYWEASRTGENSMSADEKSDERIKRFAALGNQALLDLMPLHAPLREVQAEHNHRRALMLLSTECLGRSQTIFYLILGLRLWDAEILGRVLFEGTVKFAYILESPSTVRERLVEFSEVLPAISKLRWHGKAEEALAALGDDGSLGQQPYRDMILAPEELAEIRRKYPREERRRVEGRWGFTELATAISKPGGAFGPVGRSSLHRYMVSSHLIHMTHEGVDMPLERDDRPVERRDAVALAHAARLVGDCFELTFLRAAAIRRFLGLPVDDLFEIRRRHEGLLSDLEEANQVFGQTEYGNINPAS